MQKWCRGSSRTNIGYRPVLEYLQKLGPRSCKISGKNILPSTCWEERGRVPVRKIRRDHPWGIWRIVGRGEAPVEGVGIGEDTETMLVEKDATTYHTYRGNLPSVDDWKLTRVRQQPKESYLGSVPAGVIDALGRVPSMTEITDLHKAAIWVRKGKDVEENWQRRLHIGRVMSIKEFMDGGEHNSIVNSIILYLPHNAEGVTYNRQTGVVSFDMERILHQVNEKKSLWEDFETKINEDDGSVVRVDRRPLWILDGQHRTRGMAISKRGSMFDVPVTLLIGGDEPWQYSLADAAKIFTEINTLGEPLKPEMQYLLGGRSIHGSKPDNDWGPYHDVEIGARVRQRRRANHLLQPCCRSGRRCEGESLAWQHPITRRAG